MLLRKKCCSFLWNHQWLSEQAILSLLVGKTFAKLQPLSLWVEMVYLAQSEWSRTKRTLWDFFHILLLFAYEKKCSVEPNLHYCHNNNGWCLENTGNICRISKRRKVNAKLLQWFVWLLGRNKVITSTKTGKLSKHELARWRHRLKSLSLVSWFLCSSLL